MAPIPDVPTVITRTESYNTQMDVLVPVLAAGIPLFIGCALFLIAAISYRSHNRKCVDLIFCKKGGIQVEKSTVGSIRLKNNVVQSSPKLKKNIHQIRYPIDISTITRTLPTIPEVMESYSKMENINFPFIPSLSSTQLKKSFAHSTFRTPSDVPRTAELIESDSGPGKTVTATDYNSRSGRYSYQSGFHLISGITPIKDSTVCSTEVRSNGVSSGFINLNTDSNIQSSAGVNICILSPDISKHSMIILPHGSRLIRNLSSSFETNQTNSSFSPAVIAPGALSERRINNTPEPATYRNTSNITSDDSNIKINTLQYREFFIPGISFPTIPTIYPLLRSSEHWV